MKDAPTLQPGDAIGCGQTLGAIGKKDADHALRSTSCFNSANKRARASGG